VWLMPLFFAVAAVRSILDDFKRGRNEQRKQGYNYALQAVEPAP